MPPSQFVDSEPWEEAANNGRPRPFHGWHLDKRVPIGLIIVLAMQGIAGLWVIADIKKDVEVLKSTNIERVERDKAVSQLQHDRDERQDRSTAEGNSLVRADIQVLAAKLDRFLERPVK